MPKSNKKEAKPKSELGSTCVWRSPEHESKINQALLTKKEELKKVKAGTLSYSALVVILGEIWMENGAIQQEVDKRFKARKNQG